MRVHRSHVLAALAAGAMAVAVLAACGDDDDSSSTPSTQEASTTTTTMRTTTSVAPLTQDEAIEAWVEAQGAGRYLGVCPTDFDAAFPLDGVCSVVLSTTAEQTVQGLGPPFSEVTAFLLLEASGGGWSVADAFIPPGPYDLTGAPDWLPDQPAGG